MASFARTSESGDRAECADVPETAAVWPYVTSSRENSLGSTCEHYDRCFVMRARKQALEADVVVVNLGTNDHTRSRAGAGAAARRFLRTLAAACPSSRILVLAPFGGQLPELAEAACGVPRVRYVPTDGWWDPADAGDGVHPYGYANARDIVPRLAPLVAAALGAR